MAALQIDNLNTRVVQLETDSAATKAEILHILRKMKEQQQSVVDDVQIVLLASRIISSTSSTMRRRSSTISSRFKVQVTTTYSFGWRCQLSCLNILQKDLKEDLEENVEEAEDHTNNKDTYCVRQIFRSNKESNHKMPSMETGHLGLPRLIYKWYKKVIEFSRAP